MGDTLGRRIKCEGRFSQLREYLYDEIFPIVLEDRQMIYEWDLVEAWDLLVGETPRFDIKDPYYSSRVDKLRRSPSEDHLSLIPLIERPSFTLADELVAKYALSMGNDEKTTSLLSRMNSHPEHFMGSILGKEPSHIYLDDAQTLKGYSVSGNVGIGTISSGGYAGGGIRSDSPFLLEVYKNSREGSDLVAVIGFWTQDDTMLVSQMQSSRNAQFPEGVPFGVGCLRVAESAAQLLGYKRVVTYTAKGHPIFKEHPENWRQFGEQFVAIYDNSSKKLGYNGGRCWNTCHEKVIG